MMSKFLRSMLLVMLILSMFYSFIGCSWCGGPTPPPTTTTTVPPPPTTPYTPVMTTTPTTTTPPPMTTTTTPTTTTPPPTTTLPPTVITPIETPPVGNPPDGTPPAKLETIYFDFDKSFIRSDAAEVLTHNASWLKKEENANAKIQIEGHCDERGTDEYNMALGERRSRSTKEYLTKLGIDAGKLDTISYGESRPARQGHDEESAWRWNRRSEFIIK